MNAREILTPILITLSESNWRSCGPMQKENEIAVECTVSSNYFFPRVSHSMCFLTNFWIFLSSLRASFACQSALTIYQSYGKHGVMFLLLPVFLAGYFMNYRQVCISARDLLYLCLSARFYGLVCGRPPISSSPMKTISFQNWLFVTCVHKAPCASQTNS